MKAQYEVYEANLQGLQKRIAKLSERSVKLGGVPITIAVLGHRDVEDTEHKGRMIRLVDITVEGEMPRYNGWSFVATLDHTPDGNVIRSVPGFEVDPKFRSGLPCCEHCQTARNRRDTYVVRHEDGRVLQVGSTCMKDFLGHTDPHHLTSLAEMLLHAFDLGRNSGGTGMNDIYRINVASYLEWVASVTIKTGYYVTRKAANERGIEPTSVIAYNAMMNTDRAMMMPDAQPHPYAPDDEAKALAAEARKLVIARFAPVLLEDGDEEALRNSMLDNLCGPNTKIDDFEHNLLTCAKSEAIEPRLCGIAAYIVEYYRKEKGLNHARRDQQLSENFTRIYTMFQTARGQLKRPVIRLADEQGHRLVLSLASAASKNVGWVYVKQGTGFEAAYFGKISPEGRFFPIAACPPTVKAQLASFAQDPETVAAKYGKLTGCCCFCGRNLTDDRSTHVGYGPVCAAKFGLDWGSHDAAPAVLETAVA